MSQSSASWNGDISARYERLAGEFTKLRAQAAVLKNGVLDERNKNEKLTEEIRSKDTALRKLRSENESLTFRNEQLLKRVQALQDEVEEFSRSGKGKDKKAKKDQRKPDADKAEMETKMALLEEELKNKLRQNEILTGKISEAEEIREQSMKELKETMEKEIVALKRKLIESEGRAKVSSRRMMLVPSPSLPSGGLSVPLDPSPPLRALSSPLWLVAESGKAFMGGLATFFQLIEQRLGIFPFDATMEKLPPHVKQLESDLGKTSVLYTQSLAIIEKFFGDDEESWETRMDSLCDSLIRSAEFAEQALPNGLRLLCDDENKCTWADSVLERQNEKWRAAFVGFLSSLLRTAREIRSTVDGQQHRIVHEANLLVACLRDLHDVYIARWSLECRLPVVTKRMSCVGVATRDCIARLLGDAIKAATRIRAAFVPEKPAEVENKPQEEDKSEEESNKQPAKACMCGGKRAEPVVTQKQEKKDESAIQMEVVLLRSRLNEMEGEREKLLVDAAIMKKKMINLGASSSQNDKPASDECEEMQKHYADRLRDSHERIRKAEAKGAFFEHECENLVRGARCLRAEKEELTRKVDEMEKENIRLADELATIREGYEGQLSQMTEHMASLNLSIQERENQRKEKPSLTRRLLFK